MAFTISVWILVFIGSFVNFDIQLVSCAPQVPCYFIFGDSLIDSGNNNDLQTIALANYPPYGVDFPDKSTGRFTNGRTIADFIAQFLGFEKFIPSYASAKGEDIMRGVNYGSGAAGIRDDTSTVVGARVTLNEQLQNHGRTISRIRDLLGNQTSADEHLGKCLYTLFIGSNDYINNYYLPKFYQTSSIYTPDEYAQVLIQQFSEQLKTLYNYGARKFALFGLGALGCTPEQISISGGTLCVEKINAAAELFNDRLTPLVDEFNAKLIGAKFIYVNTTSIMSLDQRNPGIQILNQPCCPVNPSTGLCVKGSTPCSNRNDYSYFDAVHPTEITYQTYSLRAYDSALPSDTYPMDIRHLVQLDCKIVDI